MEGRLETTRHFLKIMFALVLLILMIKQAMLAPVEPSNVTRIHLQHAVAVRDSFPCKEPQQRSYSLDELLRNLVEPSVKTRRPVYIVLKRCDSHSGCCSAYKSCMPVSSYYEEIEIEMSDIAKNNRMESRWIRVKQHASCSCNTTDFGQAEPEPLSINLL